MTEEAQVSEEESVAVTETAETEPKTEETEQETQPEEKVEKVYTKEEVDKIMTKRVARETRKLQREWEAKEPKPKEVKTSKDAPKLEDYESTEEYLDARQDWRLEQREAKKQKETAAEVEQKEIARIKAKYTLNAEKTADKYADFDDVVEALEDPDIPFYVKTAVQDSDIGGELSYYLGSNPDELDKLLTLSPFAAVKAIGKLEDKISKPKAKETSKAPAPFKGVKGDTPTVDDAIKDGEDFESFRRKRNVQLGRV